MNHTCSRHLGGTVTPGHALAGTHYASRTERKPHSHCWMELAVFDQLPRVPSLAGTLVQQHNDLLASTTGAGETVARNIRLQFELFDDESPKTCANFRRLCCGQTTSRQGQTYCFQGLTPSYRGTFFHKIIPHFCAQGGDITMRVDGGANHHTSAGRGWFADENKKRRHNEAGLLSMANNGPNSNGAQFFITTASDQERALNGRHVCFGRVTQGLADFLREVGPYGNVQGHPSRYVVVVDCGAGEAPGWSFDATASAAAEGEAATAAATTTTTAVDAATLETSGAAAAEEEGQKEGPAPVVADAAAAGEGAVPPYSKPGLPLRKSLLKTGDSVKSNKRVTYADGV